jgi:hypothetical protein
MNEFSAKVCGNYFLRICQRVIFICEKTWSCLVYESDPHILVELRNNIRSAVETIEVTFLLKVYLNMTTAHKNVLILKVVIFSILSSKN